MALSLSKSRKLILLGTDLSTASALQIYAINTTFDTRFPLPENFVYSGDILDEHSVKCMLQDICKINYTELWILAVEEVQYIDDESWRILLLLLDAKVIFVLMTISKGVQLTPIACSCLANYMIVKLELTGINKRYLAALACQLLDVQAIPVDMKTIIESASNGMPGWIQNFVITLVQRGVLTIVSVPRTDAQDTGIVMPEPSLLRTISTDDNDDEDARHSYQSVYSRTNMMSKSESVITMADGDYIQMAVLTQNYNFEDLNTDTAMDVIILRTYDSLTPFEKMLLKCASVLGEVFSRRMLLHLMQSESPRNVAIAIAKLFEIRVLECEGGDFTRETSLVLVHPAPTMPSMIVPYCACLGLRIPSDCRDLPIYAFCGYMRFRHMLFRTTTYELLTESQKVEMHAKALIYLERYTRRCQVCGQGCFMRLLGLRCDDGLIEETVELRRTREQICSLSAESRVPVEATSSLALLVKHCATDLPTTSGQNWEGHDFLKNKWCTATEVEEGISSRLSTLGFDKLPKQKRVRSFSSLQLESCECLSILMFAYCQIIDHCKGAGEEDKLYEAYLEYANLSIISMNVPQAIRLLHEAEIFIQSHHFYKMNVRQEWVKNFEMAKICSMRGACMLQSGDLKEAREQLLLTMELYGIPFPSGTNSKRIANARASIKHWVTISAASDAYVATDIGLNAYFFDDIAEAYNYLFRLFEELKEMDSAILAAKLALSYALRSNANFPVLCSAYGNLISVYRRKQQFSMCVKLEKRAMELCHKKRGILDVTEVQAVCYLYTNIFLFYVESAKKLESLEFGLSVMQLMTNVIDLSTRQILVIWMLKLLLTGLRIHDMVTIMREFFYMTDHYDISSQTWYYYHALVILLDTGYCVESYNVCERFYIKKGDTIVRCKTPEAAWNFFVIMWLMTLRTGAWEKSLQWEDKIQTILSKKHHKYEYYTMILVRLIEGLLIMLVKEMDSWNVKRIALLEKTIQSLFKDLKNACKKAPLYRPRRYFLTSYHSFIRGKRRNAFSILNRAHEAAKSLGHEDFIIWCEHTRRHWMGILNPEHLEFWVNHAAEDKLLDYHDFDQKKIVPYTLPLPTLLVMN